jgi:signal transduction histidine kinase
VELVTTPVLENGALVGAQGIARDITDRIRSERALLAAHAQLLQAREDERKRLAGELHDSLGQQVISLHLRMQGLLPEVASRLDRKHALELERIAQGCQAMIAEVRSISHGLWPPLLESVGLAAALREMAVRLSSPIPIRLACATSVEKLRFPPEAEIALFRIAQEALGNAVRHSQATRVKLSLEYKQRRIILSIRDDGVGFDMEASGAGLGLSTMRDRARTIGGELLVESRPGSTHVEVRVPAEARARE